MGNMKNDEMTRWDGGQGEDRQEAAPEVGLRIDNLLSYADSLQSDTIYLDPDDIAFIHEYYGCKTGCCTKFAGKIMKPKVGVVPGVPSEATKGIPVKFDDSAETREAWQALVDCGPEMHQPTDADLITRRVPSEATPSKENEMVGSTGRIHKKTLDCETAGCRPAPAPEVQGTPTRHAIAQGMEFWALPVGTPQKETPTMPYGAGAQNFAVKTYAETADQIRAATFVGTDKFVQTDTQQLPASVPEGVQGKEPQTPPRKCNCGSHKLAPLYHRDDCPASQTAPIPQASTSEGMTVRLGRDATFAEKEYSRGFHEGHALGEAAGRRSAITELKALQPDGYAHRYHDGIRYGVDGREINGGKPIEAIPLFFKSSLDKLCAELQEKTKP